jgi:hypothetical protein
MKKLGVTLCGIFLLTSCGKNASLNFGDIGGSGGGNGGGLSSFKDNVDTSQCQRSVSNPTLMGTWILHQVGKNNLNRDVTLVVQDKSTTITARCFNPVTSRTATVTVPSQFDRSSLVLQNSDARTVGDRQMTCQTALAAGSSGYTLKGDCLTINLNGEIHTYNHVGM